MSPAVYLGIETSGTSTGVALASPGKVLAESVEHSGCGHNEVLMPLLDRLLQDAGLMVRDLAGIGVGIGPGMFTSLRVGLSAAKGLATAHRIPVAGVNTLWSLARTARPDLDRVLALIDARKRQVYAALYLGGQPAIAPSITSPELLASEVRSVLHGRIDLVAAGSGIAVCADMLAAAGIKIDPARVETPSPGVVALEAAERIACGTADVMTALEPLYLRRTDAELTREKRLRPGA